MNEKDLIENIEKTKKQIDVASEIYQYALAETIKIVDEIYPHYKENIEKTKLEVVRYNNVQARRDAIEILISFLIGMSGEVRL